MAHIELIDVSKKYDNVIATDRVNFEVNNAEFVVLVGPSGCGKSTLLRSIAGLETISDGTIKIDGIIVNDTPPAKRDLAMVFQSYALYPHMSVYKNLSFGLETMKYQISEIRNRVEKTASILQIEELLERKPKQLSGGQKQRVAIGRAIVREPKAFLFDEPLSNLDAELRVQMRVEIAKLHKSIEATTLYVTHDQVEAMTMADRIVVLNSGKVEQVGSPLELYNQPKNIFVASFIGSPKINLCEASNYGSSINILGQEYKNRKFSEVKDGVINKIGFRPESIKLYDNITDDNLNFNANVLHLEQLGGETYIYLELENKLPVIMHSSGQSKIAPGAIIKISIPIDSLHLFDKNGFKLFYTL